MTRDRNGAVLRQIRAVFNAGHLAALTDSQLLERSAARDGEPAELAFAALVERHGPMVLHVCRGVLRHEHDAQDAFQATFLVLARKAGTLRVQDSLGPWLHGVAYRVACHARSAAARRVRHERRAAELAAAMIGGGARDDPGPALHEEIHRLPERQRAVIVLCDLEGLTHEQAARQLGLPVGTVKSRQARGRDRLRSRLIRRGLAPSAGAVLAAISAGPASAALPSALADSTAHAVMQFSAGNMATGAVSAAVTTLTEGVINAMIVSRLTITAVILVSASLVAIGAGVLVGQEPGAKPTPAPAQDQSSPEGVRPQGEGPADPAARDQREEDLKRRLVEIARRRLETQQKFYEEGRITIDRYLDASALLMTAEVQASETREGRIAAARAHLDRAKQVEERERAELQIGRGTTADVTEAESRRIQAELDLKIVSDSAGPHEIASLERRLSAVERRLDQLVERWNSPRVSPKLEPIPSAIPGHSP